MPSHFAMFVSGHLRKMKAKNYCEGDCFSLCEREYPTIGLAHCTTHGGSFRATDEKYSA